MESKRIEENKILIKQPKLNLSNILKERLKHIKKFISNKFESIIEQLNLNKNKGLTRKHVKLILDILNIELTPYQKAELYSQVERTHHFSVNALKCWILRNQSFILCKAVGSKIISKKKLLIKTDSSTLPLINQSTYIQKNNYKSFTELIHKNNTLLFKKENIYDRAKDRDLSKRILERINNSIKEQQMEYKRNMKLLMLMKRNLNITKTSTAHTLLSLSFT